MSDVIFKACDLRATQEVVQLEDWNTAQSELAALREELAHKEAQLDSAKCYASECLTLQAAAEQRNAEATLLLRQVSNNWLNGVYISSPGTWFRERDELLTKPTESGASEEKRKADFIRLNSAPHCPECGHPDCNGQCYGDDMMGASE